MSSTYKALNIKQTSEKIQNPKYSIMLKPNLALAGVAQLIGTLSCRPKGHEFDSWLGHIPRL